MGTEQKRAIGDLFGGHAKLYALARPTYPDSLYDYLSNLCVHTNKVWDCATGNGQAAIPLAQRFRQVMATDINAQQIEAAKQASNIHYSVASAESTEFESNTFDMVCVAQALHWFDYEKFWPEVDRVLVAGGVFAAWGYDWTRIDFDVDFLLQENLVEPLKNFWNPKAKLLWGGYQAETVAFPYVAIESPQFTIELNWNLEQLFNYFLSWSALQAYIKQNGTGLIENAKQQVMKKWGDPSESKLILMPIHTLVGQKQ